MTQSLVKTTMDTENELEQDLIKSLSSLPSLPSEAIVGSNFIETSFFSALGFSLQERIPGFNTGRGRDKVDYALRHNSEEDNFLYTGKSPHLLVEIKGRDVDLTFNSRSYHSTVVQLKRYLLSTKCKSAKWGIITNSKHIQLFKKHNKTILPATPCIEISPDNIYKITNHIKNKINNTPKALTVAVYNNKGGVGKTTSVINLAGVLTRQKKKVLVIDFDPNQGDLSNSLNIFEGEYTLYNCLRDKRNLISLKQVTRPYIQHFKGGFTLSFDVIPVDKQLANLDEDQIRKEFSFRSLRSKIESLKSEYDYILIDVPPNWRFFSISAVYASDVVLIPTKHNNIRSLQNAAIAIQKYIPEIQEARQEKTDGFELGAVALPIFFNGEKISTAARKNTEQAIQEIIKKAKVENGFNLAPYFGSYHNLRRDNSIFELPNSAYIANCNFRKIPAVYKYKVVYDYYSQLAKEYFLQ